MTCTNCGAEIGNSKKCEFCGYQISLSQLKEQEQFNKKGCPNCGSTNITFEREKQGEVQIKKGKAVVRETVGLCKDCGYTWNAIPTKAKRKTWLWVLGWICIFPVPLTILVLRKDNIKNAVKYCIIAAAWLLYFGIGLLGGATGDNTATAPSNIDSNTGNVTSENELINNKDSENVFLSGTNAKYYYEILCEVAELENKDQPSSKGDMVEYSSSNENCLIKVGASKETDEIAYVHINYTGNKDATNIFMALNRIDYKNKNSGELTNFIVNNIGKTNKITIGDMIFSIYTNDSKQPVIDAKTIGLDNYAEKTID